MSSYCEKCGGFLYQPNPNQMLMSHPPKIELICKDCGHKTYQQSDFHNLPQ